MNKHLEDALQAAEWANLQGRGPSQMREDLADCFLACARLHHAGLGLEVEGTSSAVANLISNAIFFSDTGYLTRRALDVVVLLRALRDKLEGRK